MLTIYSVPVAVYCAKLRIILRHKSIPFQELPPPGGYGSLNIVRSFRLETCPP